MGDQELVEDLPASSLRSDNLKENNSEELKDNVTPTEKEKTQENGTPLIESEKETEIQSDGDKDGSTTEESKIQEDLQESEDPEKPQEEPEEVLGPDDVLCDSCIDRPSRAKKSCLTCLVSYCESHLRPHLENVKFQSHKLVEPLRDIERLTCESHGCPLELFCCADTCCVCQECVTDKHRRHNTLPITEARKKIERELKDKQIDVLKTITAADNAINKLQLNTVTIEASVKEVQTVIEEQFNVLLSAVEQAKRDVNEILDVEQRQALQQAEGIRVHMEQRCAELKKTQSQIEKITKNKSAIGFLQEYSEWKKESTDVSLPGVYIGLMDRLQTFSRVVKESTKAMCDQLQIFYNNKLKEKENVGIKTTVYAIMAAKHNMSIPNPNTRDDFLKYSTPLNLDADTAHQFLRLTEEKKKVTNTTPWQHGYPDLPERFEHCRQVLTVESFYLGRHYFEVDLRGEGTHVGLTYKSIDRKGSESNSCITGNNFSWCLQWNGRSFSAWHSDVETPLSVPKATRIGVYVDYSRGVLTFYDVENSMALIHQYQAQFREPLYPAFWLPKKENTVLLVEPGGALTLKTPSPVSSP
ncbi:tripartite motif-containing protein 16 [Triplophysa rosa]|uniref:Tripartite motif-containing protein 16 n=1 Tax=Triplophysa rosa TaxID=992332 RepID=A0A9W7THV9_TRIRA|nr:tripartite motif-containing protein 16 [Triplophysa rosa]KAI7796716.1 putative tripartite motif-containing protein 16 [Triplophysa rosa]